MTREGRFQQLIGCADEVTMKARSVRGGTYAMASEAIDFVLRFGSTAILARLLVPEHFGLLGMVMAITTIAERFKDLGLSSATVQRAEINHAQISTLCWLNAAVGVLLMFVVAAMAHPIAHLYNDQRLVAITYAIAFSFFWSGATIQHQALLRRSMQFRRLAFIQVGASILSIVIAIIMAALDFGYWALVAREVTRNIFLALGSWACLPWMPGVPSRQAGVGAMLKFGGSMTGFYIVHFLSVSIGQVLIGKLFGAAALGIYRQGFALILAPIQQLSGPVTSVADAALARLQNDPPKYRRYYEKLLLLMSLSTMPVVAVLAVFAQEIVLVFLGPQWIEATPIFRILAIAVFLNPAISTAGTVATTCGYVYRFLRLGVIQAVVLISLFFAGIPWGPEGVASAHLWAFLVMAAPWILVCLKDTPVPVALFARTIARPLLASVVMACVCFLFLLSGWTSRPWTTLAAGLPLAGATYLTVWLVLPGGARILRELAADIGGALNLGRFIPARFRRSPTI